ncbi:glycosyltransferase family 39 protein [Fulvivirga ligni]|uniref:glycosyltransferase family 39 protein n=1 Tax=Fulvivirga ligni TaxID=2904246 RepID=UPI001F2C1111|nr:glycosyltransferase family 39 protein [Fulvivirga ligni]UII20526.1 glycosyltransferase family 39 protein [Fulvivirga ligni]
MKHHSLSVQIFLAIAFLIGIIIRAVQFFAEPSMWKDELFSVVNIEKMTFWELMTQQPEYNQVAPVGFYVIQKFFYSLIGSTEMAFRLYPFIGSLITLWLFYLIARKFLTSTKLVLAVFFMATVIGPWWQSFNAKPYTGDIMFLMFFVWIGLTILDRTLNRSEIWTYGLIGFLGASASFPASIFVIALTVVFFLKKEDVKVYEYIPMIVLWLAGGVWNIIYAKLIISSDVATAMAGHHSNMLPPSGVIDYILFFPEQLTLNLGDFLTVIGANNPVIVVRSVILLLLSAITLYPIIKYKRADFFILILPVIMMIGLVGFYILPMAGRTAYYGLWPFLLLPLIGLAFLQTKTRWAKPWLTNTIAMIVILPSVLFVVLGATSLPVESEPVKKMLSYYNQHKQPGDVLYVHGSGDLYMSYYGPKYEVDDYILGEYEYAITAEEYAKNLEQLKGHSRVWFLFTGYRPEMDPTLSLEDINGIMTQEAKLIEEKQFKSAGYPNMLNLYDFTGD